MRLIDADALKPKVESMVIHKFNESDYEYGGNQAFDYVADILIDDAPTIDAVEVVRCKDCKHLKTMCEDEGTCYYWCKHWNNATDDWGHCYCGERREL